MELKWNRRDFSAESPIKETLLEELLNRQSGIRAIPDQYDEWIAAAGDPAGEQTDPEKNSGRKGNSL